jgi:hypothetical protein
MAAILPVTSIWFSTLILLPPFGGRRLRLCTGSTLLVSRKSRKAYSAALNNQKSCVVSLLEPLSPQRYHKPSPGRIGCEECCCHLTTSYLVVSEITAVVTTVAVAVVTKANTKAKRMKSWRMLVSPERPPAQPRGEGGLGERPRRGHQRNDTYALTCLRGNCTERCSANRSV